MDAIDRPDDQEPETAPPREVAAPPLRDAGGVEGEGEGGATPGDLGNEGLDSATSEGPAGWSDAETVVPRRLDRRVRRYWWTRGAIYTVVLGTAAFMVDLGIFLPRLLPEAWAPGFFGGGVTLVVLAASVLGPMVAYERWRFALRTQDLWIRRGIVIRSVSVIPYRRLQFVDTEQGPVARIFGLAELVVHTAAPGTSGRVPGLDAEEAEILRERLAHLEPSLDEPT